MNRSSKFIALLPTISYGMKSENKMIYKTCTKCGKDKILSEFHKMESNIDGYRTTCKQCRISEGKEYSLNNKEKIIEAKREYRIKNKEQIREHKHKYYLENKESVDKKNEEYRVEHKKERKEYDRLRYKTNPEEVKERSKRWKKENTEQVRILARIRDKKHWNIPKVKLNGIIKNGIYCSLKRGSKAGRHWENIVDFNIEELRVHLEKQFTEEMNWGNQGSYWHIDHKIPISVFNFNTPDDMDFKLCWALKNLRPLEAIENISKGARIDKPFQPSLLLAV